MGSLSTGNFLLDCLLFIGIVILFNNLRKNKGDEDWYEETATDITNAS